MATSRRGAWKYVGSSALPAGTILKQSTNAGECDVATAVTDLPIGVLLEDCAAGNTTAQHVSVGSTHGEIYKVIGSTTIAVGAALGPTTGGEVVTITLSTTYAQEWILGHALTAAGSGGTDIVEMVWNPQIAS